VSKRSSIFLINPEPYKNEHAENNTFDPRNLVMLSNEPVISPTPKFTRNNMRPMK
jgi:hypothetical protein